MISIGRVSELETKQCKQNRPHQSRHEAAGKPELPLPHIGGTHGGMEQQSGRKTEQRGRFSGAAAKSEAASGQTKSYLIYMHASLGLFHKLDSKPADRTSNA